MYEFSRKLPNDLRTKIFGNKETLTRKVLKMSADIAYSQVPAPSYQTF